MKKKKDLNLHTHAVSQFLSLLIKNYMIAYSHFVRIYFDFVFAFSDLYRSSNMESHESGTKRKRSSSRSGNRCMVYGCSHTSTDGYIIHRMPGQMPGPNVRYTPIQKMWVDFLLKRRNFNPKSYAAIYVCSGHFLESDYITCDTHMYKRGLRTRPPALNNDATPSLQEAINPFPPAWFIPRTLAAPESEVEAEAEEVKYVPLGETSSELTKRRREDSTYIRRKVN